ncbi:hypothetical protein C1T31_08395 [Hanstruepera neustonica]|uniref:DUF3575 domain-containing protein n=1 Tax=Hanstruepera neustonica TaxID=1445657 RepID=A0A2K1DY94_9FLAO|nr:DUF3575 domain-containing protein [Hanstruepera neustonica]PNQ73006.1 hypothetical protein C1T31_08395 [Hanstruepera neustonica]
MKKIFCLALFFSLITNTIFAQELEAEKSNKRIVKNEISFEALQLVNGVYQLSYERYVWKNFSAALAFGYKGKEGLVRFSGIDYYGPFGGNIKTNDIFYTGFQIIPEIRYYLKNTSSNNLNGFYIGLYFKYSQYNSDLKGRYTASDNTPYQIEFDAKLNISSTGFMIGYKLPITKRFNIDFIIAGPGAGNYNFKIKNKADLPDEFYENLNDALEEYSILDFINGDFRFSNVESQSKFSAFSFRYGIALGYTF